VYSETIQLEDSALRELPEGEYRIKLTTTTFLDQSATAEHVFTKQASGVSPAVTIITAPLTRISTGVTLDAEVSQSSVCPGSEVRTRNHEFKGCLPS